MSNEEQKNDKGIIGGFIGIALIVALVSAIAYVLGSDRAGDVSLISGAIGVAVTFGYVAVIITEHLNRRK